MNKKVLGVLIAVSVFILACSCGNIGGGGTPAPVQPASNILFQDNFDNSNSGWETGSYENGTVGYKSGAYSVVSSSYGDTMWGVANRSFDNFVLEVDATQLSAGPQSNNDYGVVCREQGDGNGYYFLVSGDGYAAILIAQEDSFTPLQDWSESSSIKKGNATNHLKVVCNGSTLELYVNGQRAVAVTDATFTSGDIALTATTYEDVATEIQFDNLVMTRP